MLNDNFIDDNDLNEKFVLEKIKQIQQDKNDVYSFDAGDVPMSPKWMVELEHALKNNSYVFKVSLCLASRSINEESLQALKNIFSSKKIHNISISICEMEENRLTNLLKTIYESQCKTINDLAISDCKINEESAAYLIKWLSIYASKSLVSFGLYNDAIDDISLSFILGCMKVIKNLENLFLNVEDINKNFLTNSLGKLADVIANNGIDTLQINNEFLNFDSSDAKNTLERFIDNLKDNKSLVSIILNGINFSKNEMTKWFFGQFMMAFANNKKINKMIFNDCLIDGALVNHLVNFFESNDSLKEFIIYHKDLKRNLTQHHIKIIFNSLLKNNVLEKLLLGIKYDVDHGGAFIDEAFQAITDVTRFNLSLKSVLLNGFEFYFREENYSSLTLNPISNFKEIYIQGKSHLNDDKKEGLNKDFQEIGLEVNRKFKLIEFNNINQYFKPVVRKTISFRFDNQFLKNLFKQCLQMQALLFNKAADKYSPIYQHIADLKNACLKNFSHKSEINLAPLFCLTGCLEAEYENNIDLAIENFKKAKQQNLAVFRHYLQLAKELAPASVKIMEIFSNHSDEGQCKNALAKRKYEAFMGVVEEELQDMETSADDEIDSYQSAKRTRRNELEQSDEDNFEKVVNMLGSKFGK